MPSPRGRPRRNGRKQPWVQDPLNRSLWLPASRRWDGLALTGRTTAGLGVQSAREDTGTTNDRILRDTSRHGVTATAAAGERASGPGQVPRAVPAPGDVPSPAVSPRRQDASHHRHHSSGDGRSLSSTSSRASPDRRSPPSHHERRRESAARMGQTYVARRDVQLSPKISKPTEKVVTVVTSPAQQVHVELAPEVQVLAPVADPAGADPVAGDDSATGDGPATGNDPATGDGPATGEGPATGDGSATGDGPVTGDGLATVDDPASDNPGDVSVVSQLRSTLWWTGRVRRPSTPSSKGSGWIGGTWNPPAATAPGGAPDVSMLTGTRSPLFPSIPKTINQATLVDFMALWTLLQPSVPETSTSPAVRSSVPAPRHDSTNRRSATPERRPKSPERFLHTPHQFSCQTGQGARETSQDSRETSQDARETSQEPQRVQGIQITVPTL